MSDRGRPGGSRPPDHPKPSTGPRRSGTGRDGGTRGPTLALVGKRHPRLRLLPPAFVLAGGERQRAAETALAALYRKFLEAGGLDLLRDRRSHAAPISPRERKAA
jgi:hypothetical protein